MRVRFWASSSRHEDAERRITEGAEIAMATIDGVPTIEVAGSRKPNLPSY